MPIAFIKKYSWGIYTHAAAWAYVIFFCAGCSFSSSHGVYDGSECPGWVRTYVGDGGYSYRSSDYHNEISVIFGALKQGQLYFRINLGRDYPVVFSSDRIRIILNNPTENREIEAKEESTITVPQDGDFTIIIPSFRAGKNTLPELNVHFHWSDRRVWLVKPIA